MNPLRTTTLAAAVGLFLLAACGSDQQATTRTPSSTQSVASVTRPTSTVAPTTATPQAASPLPAPAGDQPMGMRDLGPLGSSNVRIWYPAVPGGTASALYFTRGVAEAYGLPPEAAALTGNATVNAEPKHEPHNVVILTAGWASTLTLHTSLAEDLASHGYVVIGLDPLLGTENPQTPPNDDDAKRRTADLVAAIELAHNDDLASLVGPIRTDHLIVGGHSFGGTTAFEAAFIDDRITAVFNLDGTLTGRADTEPMPLPALAVGSDTTFSSDDHDGDPNRRLIGVDGASHYSFTDAPLVASTLPEVASMVGTDESEAPIADATIQIVLRFINATTTGATPPDSDALSAGLDIASS